MEKQYNKLYWIEAHKPICYQNMRFIPQSIAKINDHNYTIVIQSPEFNDGIPIRLDTPLSEVKIWID